MSAYDAEEEIVCEETSEAWEDLLENDEVSPEEEGFMSGWIEAGRCKREAELVIDEE